MEDVTSSLIMKFVSEVGEIQNRLNELERIKVELEEELGLFKCMEEESRAVKASLEEQLTSSNAEKKFLSDNLEHEIKERRRVEEEFRAVKTSLEEQLTIVMPKRSFCQRNWNMRSVNGKRVEEEFHAVKTSLEEQLAKRDSEMDVLMNSLKSEREAFNQTLGNLQEQFDTWLNKIFEGRK